MDSLNNKINNHIRNRLDIGQIAELRPTIRAMIKEAFEYGFNCGQGHVDADGESTEDYTNSWREYIKSCSKCKVCGK